MRAAVQSAKVTGEDEHDGPIDPESTQPVALAVRVGELDVLERGQVHQPGLYPLSRPESRFPLRKVNEASSCCASSRLDQPKGPGSLRASYCEIFFLFRESTFSQAPLLLAPELHLPCTKPVRNNGFPPRAEFSVRMAQILLVSFQPMKMAATLRRGRENPRSESNLSGGNNAIA